MPGLILEWRRISNAITKVVFPLQREKRLNPFLRMERIYPVSQSHTATGERGTDVAHVISVMAQGLMSIPGEGHCTKKAHTASTQLETTWILGRAAGEQLEGCALHQSWCEVWYLSLYLTWGS